MWRFPLGTFAINVTGAFLIGLLMAPFTGRWQGHTNWRLFLVAGVLGGYTTFSSFEYETL
jgi:CrcB protein